MLTVENRKILRSRLFHGIVPVFVALGLFNGVANFLQHADELRAAGTTWTVVWSQSSMTWSTLFFPFILVLYCGMLTTLDNQNRNWMRLATYDATKQTLVAKLVKALQFCLYCQFTFLIGNIVAAAVLRFPLDFHMIPTMTLWCLAGVVGAMGIAALQLYLGLLLPSYPTQVGIGIGLVFMGFAFSLMSEPLARIFPYAQAAVGNHLLDPAGMSFAATLFFVLLNLTVILLGTVAAFPRLEKITS
ncbi:MAG: ABC transporter permease [Corynebacterium sp.]|nr:ABC transporter permease [Corynebacterium sp.]